MIVPRVVIGGAAAAVALLLACAGTDRSDSAKLRQAGTARESSGAIASAEFTVDTSTVETPLELPAQLYVEHDAVVVARAQGTVDSLFVELGDHVSAGQTIATLENTDQEIALANAEAGHENLERVANRARELRKSGATTSAELEQADYQLRTAEIARRKARRDLELTRVIAPFAGVITSRLARPRRFVAVGDTLFRVTEAAPLYARIRVPESSARLVRIGERATVVGVNGGRADATIVHAAPIIDAASGTRETVLRIGPDVGLLVPGATVAVQLGRERRRVVSVPRAAIAPEGYALVIENGRTTLRSVSLGGDIGSGRVEVVSGLSPGERLARPGR